MRASTVGHRMGSGSATIMLRSSLGNSLKPGQKQMVQGGNNTRFLLTEGEFSKLFYASPPISIVRASKTICFKLQKRSLVTNTNDQMTNPKIPDSSPLETNLEDTLYEPAVPNPLPSSLIIKYGDKKAELLFDENGNSLDRYALDFNLLEECLQIALAAYNHSCIDKSNHFFPNKINFDQQCNTVYPAVTLAYAGSSGHRLIRTFGKKIAYSLQSNMLILSDEQFLRIVDHLSRHAAVDTLSSTVGSLGNRDSTLSHPKQDDEVRTKLLTFERTSAKRRSFKKISRKRSTSESLFEYWKSNKTNQNDLSDPHVLSKFFQFKQQNQENWPHFKESALLPQTRKFNECSSSGITRASDRPVLSHRMRTNPWATALDYIFSWIDELVPPTFLAPPTPDITIENKSNTPAIKAPRTGVDVPPNTVYLHGALFSTPFFTNQLHRFLKSKNCKRSFIIIEGSQDNDYPGEFDSDENYEMEEIKSDDANHDFNWLIERGIPRILLTPPIHKISPPNLVKKHQSAIKEDQSLLKLERNINVLKPLVPNEFIDLLSEAAPRTLLAERDLTPSECRILALLLSNVINCNYQNPGKISQKSELYTGLKSNSKESIIGKLKNVLSSFTGNRKLQSRALEMLQTGDKKEETQGDVEDLATRLGLDSQSLNKHEKRLLSCVVSPKQVDTKFEVIGALDDVKGLLQHLISARIKFPELFTKGILRDAVSGILLFGPPGTGKTMLARGVATESGASFIAVNASSIYDMYVGEGEKNVKVSL